MKNPVEKLKKLAYLYINLPLLKRRVLEFYKNSPEARLYSKELSYLKKHNVAYLLGDYKDKYLKMPVKTYYDKDRKMSYVLHDSKRLYFRKSWSGRRIVNSYRQLLIEQDAESSHRYEGPDFQVNAGDVVFDIGAAEGIFTLSVIDKVKMAYLFEYDNEWIEALNATFSQWPGKVEIIPKYASDVNDEASVTLDHFTGGMQEAPFFFKIDVEGMERKVLNGMNDLLSGKTALKIAVCTYHWQNDAVEFERLLKNKNFNTQFSDGYMLYHRAPRKLKPPYFIKGLLRASKS